MWELDEDVVRTDVPVHSTFPKTRRRALLGCYHNGDFGEMVGAG